MRLLRGLRVLHSLGIWFWLALPLLGLSFWVSSGLMSDRILSRPYGTVAQLEADTQLEVNLAVTILVIKAEIYKKQGFTKVEVKTTKSALTKLEFQFPVTEFNQVESTIAQELGLSLADIRKLVRYQVVY
ncbi:hypothetical protein [Aliterella atlantica]|uniref:Uncharacterized protein n=1 Tax=Aliterella atlantica CENA595 TaxID=1618023 RepID=A0A0D8ZVJ0_9CYAN|nr:hypothetical protein [Aliterella atlantica]KJH72407.1 hypothetical protein UH38_06420 [Aliterella atlantica CENA595]